MFEKSTITKSGVVILGLAGGIILGTMLDRKDFALANPSWKYALRGLTDPLSLFAARSPGERGADGLLSTKNRAAVGPHERVLSKVRHREPPADLGDIFNPEPSTLPSDLPDNPLFANTTSGSTSPGSLGSAPFAMSPGAFRTVPSSGSNSPQGSGQNEIPPNFPPQLPPSASTSDLIQMLPPTPPQLLDVVSDIPTNDIGEPIAASTPGTPSRPSDIIAIPEPASWVVMLAGLVSLASMARWRWRRLAQCQTSA